jgi:hypothetical protein
MPINGMRNSALIIILGLTFVLITLTNLPVESHGDRRHLSQDRYTAIGKLLACGDVKTTTVTGILIREGLGCGFTGGIALSANIDASLRTLTRELFMNHTSATRSLNYTALGESLTCEDINPISKNAPTFRILLSCQDVNNQNSTTTPQ